MSDMRIFSVGMQKKVAYVKRVKFHRNIKFSSIQLYYYFINVTSSMLNDGGRDQRKQLLVLQTFKHIFEYFIHVFNVLYFKFLTLIIMK